MVPQDRFTPHGYLDNPHHTRNLNPSGVLRSLPGIGFAWHYPAFPKGYGYREIYRSGFRLYLLQGDRLRLEPQDFPGLHARRHTKNELVYSWGDDVLQLEASFFLVAEHTLACRARLVAAAPATVVLGAAATYARHLGAAGVWGESGLVGRVERDAVILQGFEDGEAFALAATPSAPGPRAALGAASLPSPAFLAAPRLDGDHVVATGRRGDTVTLHGAAALTLALQPDEPLDLQVLFSRGLRRDLALDRLDRDRGAAAAALARHRAEDRHFWRLAPRLDGDWPEHWRRGAVYDFETLRMMVRPPIGIYRHRWDAMQIQAPRVVLAEAAIDALLLSYADLDTAKELLLGTFADAPKANVPCSREDGSFNMVGANGSECGTAPEWGYPLRVAAHLFDLAPDPAWLEALYPGLEDFLRWWEEHRRDDEGYLVYDNSWESGQDLSARFGPQKEGGGSTIRMVRPVDLQAAMADACRTMARFARILGRDEAAWKARAEGYARLTEGLWHRGAYRDHDARVGWSDVWDVMQLAPVALGLSPEERIEELRARIRCLADDVYLWPMFVWTAADAAQQAGEHEVAARLASATIDRAYRSWDRLDHEPGRPLPGVTCEYWGADGQNGAEGYGWGAFGLHLLFGTLLGFRPTRDGLELRPNLPAEWPDGRYAVRNLRAHSVAIDLALDKRGASYRLALEARGARLAAAGQQGGAIELQAAARQRLEIAVRS